MQILLTGGTGYIGSHTAVELLAAGHEVVIVDNLCNSDQSVVQAIEKISQASVPFYELDIRNTAALDTIFDKHDIDAVIHLAGLKAVGESVKNPDLYHHNNVGGAASLFEAMKKHGVKNLVFSSSATVYGSAPYPYEEAMPTGIGLASPYSENKYDIERLMQDICKTDSSFRAISLRYFNPVGAHPSGLIGENPRGVPNNLMPFITQTAAGIREYLQIFGDDYDTPDGTCIRDYIHVVDLARGHLAALEHLQPGFDAINLGSGAGTSVLELVHAFEASTGQTVPYKIVERRPGDLPEFYAKADKASRVLGWKTTRTIEDMCIDAWRWQSNSLSVLQ